MGAFLEIFFLAGLVTVLLIAGLLFWNAVQQTQQRMMKRLEELQAEVNFLRQSTTLAPVVPATQASPPSAPVPVAQPEPAAVESAPTAAEQPAIQVDENTLAMLATVIAAHLGKRVRIRRARLVPTVTTAWAQQGRAIIQASHFFSRGVYR
jgi:cytoskeletal protein RodZ